MSSALKPAIPPGGAQASPGKAVPAGTPPPLVGQNLVHHQATPAHATVNSAHIPMSPVSQNMAQMAQNMSHDGNLSHVNQNNGSTPVSASNGSPQPNKTATGAPLSLVQDKFPATTSKPLALTRPADRNDDEVAPAQANGTVESSYLPADAQSVDRAKSEPNVPVKTPAEPTEASVVKPADSSPSKAEKTAALPTNKPPSAPKPDSTADNQLQVNKLGSSTDVANKTSPAKPSECKQTPQEPAVAPTSTEQKTPDESASAKTSNVQPVPHAETKPESKPSADPKPAEASGKPEAKVQPDTPSENKTEAKSSAAPAEQPQVAPSPAKKDSSPQKTEEANSEAIKDTAEVSSTPVPKKAEPKTATAKSNLKLATVTPLVRKRRQETTPKSAPAEKVARESSETPESRASKRSRTKVQPYQSPTAEIVMATKLSASATPNKPTDDKLIVFYKNEYLAVRNAEGGFYVCQTMQNVYRSSRKIKIRWLSQDKTIDPSGDTYKPDFYDTTDMECVLTTLSMTRSSAGGGAQILSASEASRARSILDRAINAETGKPANIQLTEEHPDGLDLSLYKDESQLDKKKSSRKHKADKIPEQATEKEDTKTPSKRAKVGRKSGKSTPKAESAPATPATENKRKSGGISGGNKTALSETAAPAKSPAAKSKETPAKKTPARATETPKTPAKTSARTPKPKSARKSDKELKMEQLAATPSTSTGTTTRAARNPPPSKRRSNANSFILR